MGTRALVVGCCVALCASLGCGASSSTATSAPPRALATPPELASRAAMDLACEEAAIEALPGWMARVSGGLSTHIARGCGRQAGYDCARDPCALLGGVQPMAQQ